MLCPDPNCQGKLRTIETFQDVDRTYRTKLCCKCKWKFTTIEGIAEDQTVPERIRKPKKWAQKHPEGQDGRLNASSKSAVFQGRLFSARDRLFVGTGGDGVDVEDAPPANRSPGGSNASGT